MKENPIIFNTEMVKAVLFGLPLELLRCLKAALGRFKSSFSTEGKICGNTGIDIRRSLVDGMIYDCPECCEGEPFDYR